MCPQNYLHLLLTKLMSANQYGIIALTGRAHCLRQVAFFFICHFSQFPTLAQFFGYIFHFAGLIVGPAYFYKDYLQFIEGSNYDNNENIIQQVSPGQLIKQRDKSCLPTKGGNRMIRLWHKPATAVKMYQYSTCKEVHLKTDTKTDTILLAKLLQRAK